MAVAAIHESFRGMRLPASRRARRRAAQAAATDLSTGIGSSASASKGLQATGPSGAVAGGEDAGPKFGDGDDRDGDACGGCTGQWPLLLGGDEQRRVSQPHLSPAATRGHQRTATSSVESGSSSARSRVSAGSARPAFMCRSNCFQAIVCGRAGSGISSATGRPLMVTRSRSPASTRRRTPLTSFRSSRAGTSVTRRS